MIDLKYIPRPAKWTLAEKEALCKCCTLAMVMRSCDNCAFQIAQKESEIKVKYGWQVIGTALKDETRYNILKFPDYDHPLYNVNKDGDPMPDGGHFDLSLALQINNISTFVKIR